MDCFYAIVCSRQPAIDSVIDSVAGDKSIDSVIDSVVAHAQNEEVHAQQIIDSAGKYTLLFYYRNNGKFNGILQPV
jgi:hypothetical protein